MVGKVIQQPWHTTSKLLFPVLSMMMQLYIFIYLLPLVCKLGWLWRRLIFIKKAYDSSVVPLKHLKKGLNDLIFFIFKQVLKYRLGFAELFLLCLLSSSYDL